MRDFTGYRASTSRMRLRPYDLADLETFHDLHSREDVARYLPWPPRDLVASQRALTRHLSLTVDQDGDGITLAATDVETDRLVGEFVLFLRSVEHRRGELGYVMHPDFWGRGLATEGSLHMLGIAFDDLGLRRVIARIDVRNSGSARVLTKVGMRHEAHLVQNELLRGEWTDEDDFAILRSEWDARTGPSSATVGVAR